MPPAAFALVAGLGLAAGGAAAQTNTAPTVASAIPDQVAGAGAAFSYEFPATTFDDADDDTLTYTAVEDGETGLPAWLSFDATGRAFSGTPAVADAGTLTVKVTAEDGNGGSVSDSFDIVVGETDVCGRTRWVRIQIVNAVSGATDCAALTSADLAGIAGRLNVSGRGDAGISYISSLKAGDFGGLTSLRSLRMEHNDLTSLPAGIFDELTALVNLELLGNRLSWLRAGVFDKLTALEHLNLDGNNLAHLPAGVFDKLTALEDLRLGDNRLRSLSAGVFDKLTALRVLFLGANRLRSLPAGVFDRLTALTNLDLGYNPGAPFRPVTNAGTDRTVRPGANATLQGTATGTWGNVTWEWNRVAGASSDTLISPSPLLNATSATPSFTAPATTPTTLHFRLVVTPVPDPALPYVFGFASAADWVTILVDRSAPAAPGSLTAGPGDGRVQLTWTAPSDDGGSPVTKYQVRHAAGSSVGSPVGWTDVPDGDSDGDLSDETFMMVTGLANGTGYAFEVRAVNAVGNGAAAAATATPAMDANIPPRVANAIPDQVAGPGAAFSHEFPATTFDDADGDTLTYTAAEDGGTGLPSWLTFAGRTFSGTPALPDAGTLTVKVTADDGNGGSVSDSFDIVVGETDVCARTPAVRDAIVAAVTGVTDCAALTPAHLAAITGTLNLVNRSIATLRAGDFDGLTALEHLDLRFNSLTTLPAGVFDGLTALDKLWLMDNSLTSLPAGGSGTYTVVLDSQPSGTVTVTPASGDETAATVSGAMTFTAADWATAQTVTVTGVDDGDAVGETFDVTHAVNGYGTVASADPVAVTMTDDDTADTTAPRVASIERQDPTSSPTNSDTLKWRVTFSENVKNVNAVDFSVAGTTARIAVAVVTATRVYDVTVSGGNLAGLNATATLSFASGQDIKDLADNDLTDTTPTGTDDSTFVVDNTAPTVTVTGVPATSTAPFTATFTFPEAVTGFAAGDIAVGNGALSSFTEATAGTVFTAVITPAATGEVTVDVAAGAATDAAGNGSAAATRASSAYTADATAPATGRPAIGVVCTRHFPCPTWSQAAYMVKDFGALHEGLVLVAHAFPDAEVPDARRSVLLGEADPLMTGYGDDPDVSYQWIRMKGPAVPAGQQPAGAQAASGGRPGFGVLSVPPHLRLPRPYHWTHPKAKFDPDAHWARFGAPETFAGSEEIPGATGRTYRLQAADAGHWIRLRATVRDVQGDATTAESAVLPAATWPGIYSTGGGGPVTVASSQITAPSVTAVAVSDPPGDNDAWDAGETVEAVLTFDEAVTVDTANGTPRVQFELGADATRRNASYASGSGGTALTFRYTVPEGEGPYTNALLWMDSLTLNGGTIRSTATGADINLAHSGAAYAGVITPGTTTRSTDSGPTAQFSTLPASHDGTNTFEVELTFSGDPGGISYRTVRDSLIEATGGAIGNARRKVKGSDAAWVLTVRPSGRGSVTLTLPSRACGTKAAICIGGEPLASDATAAVPGPDTPAPALPAISIAGPAQTPVDEGAALSFTLTRTGATDGALTVAVSVAETGDVLDGTPPASVRFAPGSSTAALSVPTLDDDTFEEASTVTVTVADGTGYTVAAGAASASGVVESEDPAPMTAQFTQAQDEHDGGAFLLRFTFSHAPLLSYVTVRDALFDVTGGRIERARRLVQGSNAGWELRVVPDRFGAVTLTARATADCAAAHAVCDAAGRKFDGALERTVQGPPTLSVADAAVDEARDATLEFAVTLSRALDTAVTVAWKTADGTAEAGFDYTAANDTLTFAAGQTAKTISVAVLTDAHDEGSETMTVTLSGPAPSRVKLAGGAATGTIRNTDAMPQAWIARFGRTVAEQVLDAVEGRLRAARTPGVEVSLAGERIGWQPEAGDGRASAEDRTARAAAAKAAAADEEAGREATRLADWLKGGTDPEEEGRLRGRTVTDRDLLLGSSFNVTAEAGGPGSGGGTVSVWGRGAVTGFDGRDGDLTVDGEVASAMLGADWSPGSGSGAGRGRALAGLIVGHSAGEGGYRSPSGNGTVSSTLTGLYPWGRYALTDRVEVWGAAGYGEGALTLTPEGADAIRTDMDLWMAAAGLRGTVIDGGADGFTLTAKTDAMAVETSTAAVPGDLAASEAGVTRLRLGLEGSLPVRLGGGAVLTPSMEIGVRHDGGDAETGFGADIGGGIAWKDPKRGLNAEIRGRGLLTHEADGFRERGLSGALGWNPSDGGRGPSLSLTQTFGGAASGGADALLRRGTMEGLAANHDGAGSDDLKARRLEARFGYGFAAFGDGFTFTPEAGLGLSDTGRDYSLGWRLVRVERGGGIPGASLELSFEATRRESAANPGSGSGAGSPPEHGVGLRLTSRF